MPPVDAAAAALLPQYLEHARLLLVLCMLAVDSYGDLRYRTLMGRDRHYVMIGGAGLALFLLPGGWQDLNALFSMAAGITIALLMWRVRGLPTGDCIVVAVMSVVLPSYGGVYFVPVAVTLLAITSAAFLIVSYNLMMNVWQAVSHRRGAVGVPPLFAEYPRARPWTRAFCMFAAHYKRPWDKFTVPVWEDGRGSFSIMRTTYFDRRDWDGVPVGRLVVMAAPMNVLFLAVMLLAVAFITTVGGA